MKRLVNGVLFLTVLCFVVLCGCGGGGGGSISSGNNVSGNTASGNTPGQTSASASYTVTSLGPVTATAINASGQTTGYVTNSSGVSTVFLGASDGSVVNEGGTNNGGATGSSYAVGINSSADIAGFTVVNSGYTYAFWTDYPGTGGGQEEFYGTANGITFVQATGINDSAEMTGFQGTAGTGFYTAFRTQGPGGDTNSGGYFSGNPLGSLTVNGQSQGLAINAGGQVTGWSDVATGGRDAFRTTGTGTLTDGTGTDLGLLPKAIASAGMAINTSGQVAGYSTFSGNIFHAFRTTATGTLADGTATDLGTLGGASSHALGINDSGVVVGNSNTSYGAQHGFVYTDKMVDLNTLIPANSGMTITNAVAINYSGQIVVNFTSNSVSGQSAILTPVSSKAARKSPTSSQRR